MQSKWEECEQKSEMYKSKYSQVKWQFTGLNLKSKLKWIRMKYNAAERANKRDD